VAPSLDRWAEAAFCSSWGPMGGGADASRVNVDATCTRDPAPQVRVWRDRAGNCRIDWHRAQYSGAHHRARRCCEASLAAAGDTNRPSAGSDPVRQCRRATRLASQGRTGLGACPSRATPARRHADAALGGVSSLRAGWLWLQPLVRGVPGLGGSAVANDTADASGGRAHFRRTWRPYGRAR